MLVCSVDEGFGGKVYCKVYLDVMLLLSLSALWLSSLALRLCDIPVYISTQGVEKGLLQALQFGQHKKQV